MKPIRQMTAALCALLVFVLSACGGAGVSAVLTLASGGVGTGGTGIVFGAITGFGSLLVDGATYSSATAQYFTSSDQGESVASSAAALGLGNQVQLQLDSQGNPESVIIEPVLAGAVSQIGTGDFIVNGMTVRINSSSASGPLTYFSGLGGFASLSTGMRVAVHGAYGVDAGTQQEYIQATLIEQLPASSTITRLSGAVSKLSAAAGTFQIGTTTVQISASTRVLPSGASLANGLWVNVWSNSALGSGGEVRAGVIRARSLSGTTGPTQVSGIVSKLSVGQFQVAGITIDASASALAAALRSLRAGDYVVVQGLPNAGGSAVVANSIRSYASQPAKVELKGTITDFVDQGNFLVRGVPVDATLAQLSGAASTSLRNGSYVEVSGSVSSANGNVVVATALSAPNTAPTGKTVNYRGTVSQVDAASGSFVLTGSLDDDAASVKVRLASNVAYANGSAAQLINGASVEVEAVKNAGDIVAYGVFFRKISTQSGGSSGGKLETEGLAYGVTASSFNVNGLTIQINGVTPKGGSLANGKKVEVEFTQSGGKNLARDIAVDD